MIRSPDEYPFRCLSQRKKTHYISEVRSLNAEQIWYFAYTDAGVGNCVHVYFIILFCQGRIVPIKYKLLTCADGDITPRIAEFQSMRVSYAPNIYTIFEESDANYDKLIEFMKGYDLTRIYEPYDSDNLPDDPQVDFQEKMTNTFGCPYTIVGAGIGSYIYAYLSDKQLYNACKLAGLFQGVSSNTLAGDILDTVKEEEEEEEEEKTFQPDYLPEQVEYLGWFGDGFKKQPYFHLEFWDSLAYFIPNGCLISEYSARIRNKNLIVCRHVLLPHMYILLPMRSAVAFANAPNIPPPDWNIPDPLFFPAVKQIENPYKERDKKLKGWKSYGWQPVINEQLLSGLWFSQNQGQYRLLASVTDAIYNNTSSRESVRFREYKNIDKYVVVMGLQGSYWAANPPGSGPSANNPGGDQNMYI